MNVNYTPASLELIVTAEATRLTLDSLDEQLDDLKLVVDEKMGIAEEAVDHMKKCVEQYGEEHSATKEAYSCATLYFEEMKVVSNKWNAMFEQYEELTASYAATMQIIKVMTAA